MKVFLLCLLFPIPAVAQTQANTQDERPKIHIYMNFDPHIKRHQDFVGVYQADWLTPWEERINPRYWGDSPKAAQAYATQMNQRVAGLKTKVAYHITQDAELPSPAYKLGRYKPWVKLDNDPIVLPGFFVRLAEWAYTERYWDYIEKEFIYHWQEADYERYQDEWEHKRKIVDDWLRAAGYIKGVNYEWRSIWWDGDVKIWVMPDQKYVKVGTLKSLGYKPLPAVAWGRYPKRISNPMEDPWGLK